MRKYGHFYLAVLSHKIKYTTLRELDIISQYSEIRLSHQSDSSLLDIRIQLLKFDTCSMYLFQFTKAREKKWYIYEVNFGIIENTGQFLAKDIKKYILLVNWSN